MLQDVILFHPNFMYFLIGLLALCVGSLLNLLIYRLPLMLEKEWKQQCCELLAVENATDSERLNLFLPRSFCPKCKSQITFWQNIPILSYLFLKGRCYFCKQPISLRYPLIELLTLALSLAAVWRFGLGMQLVFALLAIWLLISLFFIDWDTQLLPDSLTLSLLWLGLIANTQSLFTALPDAVLSAAGAYVSLWLFIQCYYLLTGKIGMGHGDFKLFAALGAFVGWTFLPYILFTASVTGAIFGIIYLQVQDKTKDTPIPFGPFLCLAGLMALFAPTWM